MNISPECAVELLEIIKYLDDNLRKFIPDEFEDYLKKIKSNVYYFEIDKSINLFQNNFMDETIKILMQMMKNNA